MFGTRFGGSRFLFWALAPFLLAFAVVMAFMVSDWTSGAGAGIALLITGAMLLVLKLYDTEQFDWAGRVVAGLVFVAYVSYLVHELATEGVPDHLPRSPAEASPVNALLGLLVIGIPGLLYAVRGRFGARRDLMEVQRALCNEVGAAYTPCDPSETVGLSETARRGETPLNGLRHPREGGPAAGTSGEERSSVPRPTFSALCT
jgi:membrane-bound ClpP family serine protease